MPCRPILNDTGKYVSGYLCVAGEYKPGDPPPEGYTDRHEWARVQHEAGLRQQTCGICGLWRFPQELIRIESPIRGQIARWDCHQRWNTS